MSSLFVKDLMDSHPTAIAPDMPLLKAVELFLKMGSDVPIVGRDGSVQGIITEQDLTVQGSVHLPTFLQLFREFRVYGKDQEVMNQYLNKIFELKASDAMSKDFKTISEKSTADEAVTMFKDDPTLTTIIVLDDFNHLSGTLTRRDLIKLFGSPIPGVLSNSKPLDKEIGGMLGNFEKEFVVVSSFRTKHWVLLSALFLIVGAIIAFAFIVSVRF